MSSFLEGIDFSGFKEVARNEDAARHRQAGGGAILLPLDDVIEDPDQPRRQFGQEGLEELAASIRKRGVVQPIVVRPANDAGKHVIVMGARRHRASRIAGQAAIPAFIRVEPSDGYDQMIENIQREALLHADMARFIKGELDRGVKAATIASNLGKPRSWVSLYAGFFDMHEAIKERVEGFGIRAAYELQKAMGQDEVATRTFMEANETITQRDAIAFAKEIKSPRKAGRGEDPNEPVNASATVLDGTEEVPVSMADARSLESRLGNRPARSGRSLAVIVQVGRRAGRLMLDRTAAQGTDHAVVAFDNGSVIEEVALSKIKLIEIMQLD